MELETLQKKMKSKLTKSRYQHTLGVMYTAAALAMKHQEDIPKAMTAGLLHDCAKCYSDDEKHRLCRKYHIILSSAERRNPSLIHAKLGAYMAEHKYEVQDSKVLDAISFHTTGRPDMTVLEKIIYIADFIEPNRPAFPGLDMIRKTSFENLDYAVYLTAKSTLEYLQKLHATIDSGTEQTFLFYKKMVEQEKSEQAREEDVAEKSVKKRKKEDKRRNALWNKQKKWQKLHMKH